MNATVNWNGKMSFIGTADTGFKLNMDAEPIVGGEDKGFRPMELFLIGLAGCTGMDTISILEKMKQEVTDFEVHVQANRADSHPKIFTDIDIEYVFKGKNLDMKSIERAIELSATKYCPGQAILSKTANLNTKIIVIES